MHRRIFVFTTRETQFQRSMTDLIVLDNFKIFTEQNFSRFCSHIAHVQQLYFAPPTHNVTHAIRSTVLNLTSRRKDTQFRVSSSAKTTGKTSRTFLIQIWWFFLEMFWYVLTFLRIYPNGHGLRSWRRPGQCEGGWLGQIIFWYRRIPNITICALRCQTIIYQIQPPLHDLSRPNGKIDDGSDLNWLWRLKNKLFCNFDHSFIGAFDKAIITCQTLRWMSDCTWIIGSIITY